MYSIIEYSKKQFTTSEKVILSPRRFFQDMPTSGGLQEPIVFAIFVIFISSLLSTIFLPLILFPEKTLSWVLSPSTDHDFLLIVMFLAGSFLYTFVSMSVQLPINAAIYHFLLRICGGKGSFEATFRVLCYYLAISLVIIPGIGTLYVIFYVVVEMEAFDDLIPMLLMFLGVMVTVAYSFYMLFTGFSQVHTISMKRVFLAMIGIPLIVAGILFALMMGAVVILDPAGFSSTDDMYYNSPVQSPPVDSHSDRSSIPASYGTTPIIDGFLTPEDRWDETEQIDFMAGGIDHTLAAKHDNNNLYIMVKWKGKPDSQDYVSFFFEQDGNSHDHDLDTGRNDEKYTWPERYGPNHFGDSFDSGQIPYHIPGITMEILEDGMVSTNYHDMLWVQEWVVPLRSGDFGDIHVEHLPSTLGFRMIHEIGPNTNVYWPPDMDIFGIETWGDLEILGNDDEFYNPIQTTLVSARGNAPVIDGFYTSEDGWDGTQQIDFISRGVDFTIASKHDNEKLYFLIMWEDDPVWEEEMIGLFIEQDGNSHDHSITTGIIAELIFFNLEKTATESEDDPITYAVDNYSNGVRVMELWIPLKNNDPGYMTQIYVDQMPSSLGFTIIMPWYSDGGGTWPAGAAGPYEPKTWGHLEIVDIEHNIQPPTKLKDT